MVTYFVSSTNFLNWAFVTSVASIKNLPTLTLCLGSSSGDACALSPPIINSPPAINTIPAVPLSLPTGILSTEAADGPNREGTFMQEMVSFFTATTSGCLLVHARIRDADRITAQNGNIYSLHFTSIQFNL